jgi:hypothetical protein
MFTRFHPVWVMTGGAAVSILDLDAKRRQRAARPKGEAQIGPSTTELK